MPLFYILTLAVTCMWPGTGNWTLIKLNSLALALSFYPIFILSSVFGNGALLVLV